MKRPLVHADLKDREYCDWIRFLKDAEGWSKDRIEEHQLNEVRRIVAYAYGNRVGYRRLFERAGVTPDSIRTMEDFRSFPFVEKEMIRDDQASFSKKIRGSRYVTTGGSTGIPFGFFREKTAFSRELASKAFQYYRAGWWEGSRQIVFRGIPIPGGNHTRFFPRFNELRCSSYHLVPGFMRIYCEKALEYKPDFIRCYPSSGYLLARYIKEFGARFPKIKGILCASENLYEFQKELLSEVFDAKVFSHYGHYELAVLAGYCEHEETYHVLPQYGYAELIDRKGNPVTEPGGIGEIVATSFIIQATPFIRYRTRDLAVLKGWGCPSCGRPYQVWERVEGRLQEFIVTRTGRYISMTAVNMHDDVFDHVKQFQFFQKAKGNVIFRFVPKRTCSRAVVRDMRKRLLSKFGEDVELTMRPVDAIPLSPRGKHRFLVQEMDLGVGDA